MRRMIRVIIEAVVEGAIKRMAARGLAGESFSNREYFQHYGFTSRPLPGAEGILQREGNHIVAIASDDRRYRIEMAAGEMAIYDHQGQKCHFKSGGEIHVVGTGKITVDAADEVEVNAPLVTVNAEQAEVNASQSCTVTSPQVTVTAATQVDIVSPIVNIDGELRVTGPITDLYGMGGKSMSAMRETYDLHTHDENADTTTDPPNQLMGD